MHGDWLFLCVCVLNIYIKIIIVVIIKIKFLFFNKKNNVQGFCRFILSLRQIIAKSVLVGRLEKVDIALH